MPGLASERQQALMAAFRTLQPGEAGGEVAAFEEGLDDVKRLGSQRTVGRAVERLIEAEKCVPRMVEDLPQWRSARAALTIDGGHIACAYHH